MVSLERLRRLPVADVWKGDRLAGQLRRDGDDTVFAYTPDYLAEPGPPVAGTLPVLDRQWRATAGAVPAFFAGLLPEGARLQAVVAGARTSADDQLTLLLAVGRDAVGDVAVLPAGTAPGRLEPVALVEADVGSADLLEVFAAATGADPRRLDLVALPGVQPKVSSAMVSTTLRSSTGPAVLKLEPASGFPALVRNEDFFLRAAADCGLAVAEHRVVVDRGGRPGLLVARFDRLRSEQGWTRLAQEDGCQLLGVYPAAKYRLRAQDVLVAVADAVEAGGGSHRLALRQGLELVAISYAVGNGDLHAKNISVLTGRDGTAGVSPAYDLVSTQPYLRWRDPMALDLYGRANRLGRRHLLDAAVRLGLPEPALAARLDLIATRLLPWAERVAEIGLPDRATELLAALLRRRCAELAG